MKYKLCDVTKSANTGADAIKRAPIVEENTGLRCLRIGDVSQKRSFNEWGYTKTTEDDYKRYKLEQNDIIIARTGNTIGVNCFIENDIESVYNNGLIRIKADTDKIIPKFMYYIIRSQDCQNFVQSIAYGTSTQPNMKIQEFLNYEFEYYNKDVQSKIVSIIDSIDKKIELNTSLNNNLEQQAMALFKSWFIDYEPFNGSIPVNWSEDILGKFIEIKRGGSPRPIQDYISDSGYRWLKISDATSIQSPFILNIKEHIKESGINKTVFLKAGSLVLSNSATPGIPKILDVDSCIHDGWLYFPESKLSNEYLYLLFKFIRPNLVALGNGSVFTNLKTDILRNYNTILPDKETLKRFDNIAGAIFEKILYNTRENEKLIQLRDTLLPKLMSGEIDVSNVDISTDKLSFSENNTGGKNG